MRCSRSTRGSSAVVQAALVGSILANSVLVLGIAFVAGGLKNGTQRFDSNRARMISTLSLLAGATLALPSLAHTFHSPAAAHSHALSLICAGVLLIVFFCTLPLFLAVRRGRGARAAALVGANDRARAR